MSIPDPLSILQSILLLLDYGYRISGAGEEIQSYHRTISRTTDLVSRICANLEALHQHLDDTQKQQFCQDIREAEVELTKAQKLVQDIKKNGRWSKNFVWVLKNKAVAQTYENAVLQCHSTLSRIDVKLFFVGQLRMQGEGSFRHGLLIRPYAASG
jgi:hypothetical protein